MHTRARDEMETRVVNVEREDTADRWKSREEEEEKRKGPELSTLVGSSVASPSAYTAATQPPLSG